MLSPSREHVKKGPAPDQQEGRNYKYAQQRCLVDWALHYTGSRGLFPVEFGPAVALVSAATTHRGPPASSRASSGTPPLHSRPVTEQHPVSHHSELHCHSQLIPRQTQPPVQLDETNIYHYLLECCSLFIQHQPCSVPQMDWAYSRIE